MSTPDNKQSVYDLGRVTFSSSTLDILEIDSQAEITFAEPGVRNDVYGLPVDASIAELEPGSVKKLEQATIWVHKYPHWEARPKELAPVVVVDFTLDKPQETVREELQVA